MKQLIIPAEPDKDGNIELVKNDYCHIVSVLRQKEGSSIKVRLADGLLYSAVINKIDNTQKKALLKIESKDANKCSGFPIIILLQWLIKGSKMDTVVRQATETGIRYIIPVLGDYSIIKTENCTQTERRRRIIREARQQSGSPVETELFCAMPLKKALAKTTELIQNRQTVKLKFSELDTVEKSIYAYLSLKPEITVLAIGAEGGISAAEAQTLETEGFKTVHFKTNILRAETAAVYAAAAVQTALTEAEKWRLNE